MKRYFVDTNVFLRFLLADDRRLYELARRVFEKAESGEVGLWTTDVVILEIVWTLKSFYKMSAKEIQGKVSAVVALEGLKVGNADLLLTALDIFAGKNVGFADAYNLVLAQKEGVGVLSFDKDFRRLGVGASVEEVLKG